MVPGRPAQASGAWLDGERLAEWWWPHLPGTTYEIDPRVGGTYRIRCDAVGIGVHGTFRTIDERRLAFSWCWEDGDDVGSAEEVVVTFDDDPDGTAVTVVHECEQTTDLRQGWTDVLARLASLSPRGRPNAPD